MYATLIYGVDLHIYYRCRAEFIRPEILPHSRAGHVAPFEMLGIS
jgi:hypothetical protein